MSLDVHGNTDLETTTTTTTLATGRVGRSRSDVLNASNLHAGTSQSTQSGLSTWARSLGSIAWYLD